LTNSNQSFVLENGRTPYANMSIAYVKINADTRII